MVQNQKPKQQLKIKKSKNAKNTHLLSAFPDYGISKSTQSHFYSGENQWTLKNSKN